jgi:hypothetical protein
VPVNLLGVGGVQAQQREMSPEAIDDPQVVLTCGPGRGGTGNALWRPRPDGTADPEQESANLSCAMIPMLD